MGAALADAVERLVNLALFLAAAPGTVTAVRIRERRRRLSRGADEAAFKRMLERDKDVLRSAGLVIASDRRGQLPARSFGNLRRAPRARSSEEAAAVRAAGIALLDDPSFPFPDDLRLALAKISAEIEGPEIRRIASLADEDPARQGVLVAELSSAASRCKLRHFDYTNSLGVRQRRTSRALRAVPARRALVPRWPRRSQEGGPYLRGRAHGSPVVNASRPRRADFERPAGFDVARFIRLPFQYGPEPDEFVAVLRFESPAAWRAAVLRVGQGDLDGGRRRGRVDGAARSPSKASPFRRSRTVRASKSLGPPELLDALRDGLQTARSAPWLRLPATRERAA